MLASRALHREPRGQFRIWQSPLAQRSCLSWQRMTTFNAHDARLHLLPEA